MATQPTVKRGSTGATVKLLQERLNAKGFTVRTDGDFGQGTEDAVEQFQASCGLNPDGIVGSLTWALLMAEGEAATPTDVLGEQRAWLVSQIPADCHPDARKVLEVACSALGLKEVPSGSNGGPELAEIVEWDGGDGKAPSAYYLAVGITDKATLHSLPPWCALYVSWAVRKGLGKASWKETPFGAWYGGAAQFEDWGKKKGKTIPTSGAVPAGAVFTISREGSGSDASSSARAGHVGIVVRDNGDGTMLTVEGNVSNKVGSHQRKKADIRCVVTWW